MKNKNNKKARNYNQKRKLIPKKLDLDHKH